MSTVTIIVPVYNMSDLLQDCLRSIRKQTLRPDHVHIVDDGSSEPVTIPPELWTGFLHLTVSRYKENKGVIFRMNEALEKVHTDYVYFAAADDRIDPRFLGTLMAAADGNHGATIVHCRSVNREEDTGFAWKSGSTKQPASNTVIYNTAELKRIGGFDPELKWHSDWMAYQRLGPGVFVDQVLATANIHTDGYCAKGRSSDEQKEVLFQTFMRAASNGIKAERLCIFGWPMFRAIWPILKHRPRLAFRVGTRQALHSICVTGKNCLAWCFPKARFILAALCLPFLAVFVAGMLVIGLVGGIVGLLDFEKMKKV